MVSANTINLRPINEQQQPLLPQFQEDFLKYIEFVVRWSSYTYVGEPLPKIQLERAGLLEIYFYGEQRVIEAEQNNRKLPEIIALYDRHKKTILVSDQTNLEDPALSITLVHEAVHYLQDINGYSVSLGDENIICSETEAYDIQALWQLEQKLNTETIPYVMERALLSSMQCMGSQFN